MADIDLSVIDYSSVGDAAIVVRESYTLLSKSDKATMRDVKTLALITPVGRSSSETARVRDVLSMLVGEDTVGIINPVIDTAINAPVVAITGYGYECNLNIDLPVAEISIQSLRTVGTIDAGVPVAEVAVISEYTFGSAALVIESPITEVVARNNFGSIVAGVPVVEVGIISLGTHAAVDVAVTAPEVAAAALSSFGSLEVVVGVPEGSVISPSTHGEIGIEVVAGEIAGASLASASALALEQVVPSVSIVSSGTHGALAIGPAVPVGFIETAFTSSAMALGVPVAEIAVGSWYSYGQLAVEPKAPVSSLTSLGTFSTLEITTKVPVVEIGAFNSYGAFALSQAVPIAAPFSYGTIGSLAAEQPAPTIEMVWGLGTGGSLGLVVEPPVIWLDQNKDTTGALNASVVAAILEIISYSKVASSWPCLVLNTDNMLMSEYTNSDFVAIVQLGSLYLAVEKDGNIYSLGGADDAGTGIAGRVKTGIDDFGTSKKKRVLATVVGLQSNGELYCSVKRDDETGGTVAIPSTETLTIETRKVRSEKLHSTRTVSLELSNADSSYFFVDSVEFNVREVSRRSGR